MPSVTHVSVNQTKLSRILEQKQKSVNSTQAKYLCYIVLPSDIYFRKVPISAISSFISDMLQAASDSSIQFLAG